MLPERRFWKNALLITSSLLLRGTSFELHRQYFTLREGSIGRQHALYYFKTKLLSAFSCFFSTADFKGFMDPYLFDIDMCVVQR